MNVAAPASGRAEPKSGEGEGMSDKQRDKDHDPLPTRDLQSILHLETATVRVAA